jgi:hypothetical protein
MYMKLPPSANPPVGSAHREGPSIGHVHVPMPVRPGEGGTLQARAGWACQCPASSAGQYQARRAPGEVGFPVRHPQRPVALMALRG